MLYLDTGCLLKLYFHEPNSAVVVAAVGDESAFWSPLHALEMTTAMQLKVFRREATAEQAAAVWTDVEFDVAGGFLLPLRCDWERWWVETRELAAAHSAATGCRAFDALHCAMANELGLELLTTDARQIALARAAGIRHRAL